MIDVIDGPGNRDLLDLRSRISRQKGNEKPQ
jgi:hypothetical protein